MRDQLISTAISLFFQQLFQLRQSECIKLHIIIRLTNCLVSLVTLSHMTFQAFISMLLEGAFLKATFSSPFVVTTYSSLAISTLLDSVGKEKILNIKIKKMETKFIKTKAIQEFLQFWYLSCNFYKLLIAERATGNAYQPLYMALLNQLIAPYTQACAPQIAVKEVNIGYQVFNQAAFASKAVKVAVSVGVAVYVVTFCYNTPIVQNKVTASLSQLKTPQYIVTDELAEVTAASPVNNQIQTAVCYQVTYQSSLSSSSIDLIVQAKLQTERAKRIKTKPCYIVLGTFQQARLTIPIEIRLIIRVKQSTKNLLVMLRQPSNKQS
ncbi:hypothetical protein TTHERM_000628347 (macronuclear) [Tetrahymena thermophila SB210]|uniref:Uncharacterized protein n=1 Tax=Tetrahymena thermophila (strain SB210) TaxID=312017 RepID=W7X2N5_TETTS|nr:hypothetical protein TTHERM_000628347 [Tetrahymena thermophila SB210]EWS73530.1 hypothetical protein TTHERM_000628347 [Tetrahymena thermophila SB210]|eukprot:XP_012653920.1 hypothetical protein TTHERM_000628347 [Tetrahymena thermophila SB210]